VNATWVIQGGNLPPEIGIQNPAVKYYHRFGNPIRKSLTGKTVVVGKRLLLLQLLMILVLKKWSFMSTINSWRPSRKILINGLAQIQFRKENHYN